MLAGAGGGVGARGGRGRELGRFVDAVLGATGARKVSLVGHSQGGMMPRWYVTFLGGASKVDDLVGLAPSNHGTAFLAPGPNTANILLQDACPADVVDHQFIPDDRVALRWTLQALDRPGPADPASPPASV
jgi:triacylglycerol esterase/lipase EstA (alpha/beta hydrolase family)